MSLWVDGWRWPILASHICVWFISGVRWSHLVAAPTLADKRQTTISPLVSDRAHQQITRAGGWELEDWVELRTFYLNLNMTAMPFQYIWHQGSLQTFNRVLCFYLGLLSKDWQQQCSGVVSAVVTSDCLHDRDTEQTRSRPRARTTIRLVGLPPHAQALMHSGQWRKGVATKCRKFHNMGAYLLKIFTIHI